MALQTNDIPNLLRNAGLKATSARRAILAALPQDCKPLSADKIYERIKDTVDQVTVYRTLHVFEKAGIVHKVNLRKEAAHYELAFHHHHHIICQNCGMVEKINVCNLDRILNNALKASKGFARIDEHSLELFGMCKSCA